MPYLSRISALFAFVVALLIALFLVWTKHWHGHLSHDTHLGIQKSHQDPTPRVGGLAILAGMWASLFFADEAQHDLLLPLILSGLPAFALGLLEDLTKEVGIRWRLLATMSCGVLGWMLTGHVLSDIDLPLIDSLLHFTPVAVLFTAFAVSGVANAINIIDGFNGLAAGSVIIMTACMGLIATSVGDTELAGVCWVLSGAVLGFGLVNWPLGKLFLGDGGAYFIGFALAWIALLLKARNPEISAWAPLLVCGFPILDVLFSIWRRAKRKLSPCHPDRLHLHSLVRRRLMNRFLRNYSQLARNSTTGCSMWVVAAAPAIMGVLWAQDTVMLIIGFAVCGLLYSATYARLSQFRWCIGGATLRHD